MPKLYKLGSGDLIIFFMLLNVLVLSTQNSKGV